MKRFMMGLGIASVTLGLALPFVLAQERGALEKEDKHMGCEMLTIDRPYHDVIRKVPEEISKAGLILAAEIDWASLRARGAHGSMPGETPRLEEFAGYSNVRTYLLTDEACVNEVFENPKHGAWLGHFIFADEAGKTKVVYFKPSLKLEELKKHGVITEEKYNEHIKKAQDYERRQDQLVNEIKSGR
jgi:hypothetical protein